MLLRWKRLGRSKITREIKESGGARVDGVVEGVPVDAFERCDGLGRVAGEAGLAGAHGAFGFGREEGRIGLDHDSVDRGKDGGIAHGLGVFIRDDAGETDHRAEVQDLAHLRRPGGKAMKDEAGGVERGLLEDRQKIIKGLAAMQDDRQ